MILGVGLTPEQLDRRRQGLGGSDATILMKGDPNAILHLWGQKRGEIPHDDLSDVLPVQMGQWTEELNCYWFQKKTGFHVKHRGLECAHDEHPFLLCTLDGVATLGDGEDVVLECKHVNPFNYSMDKIVDTYYAQVQHNMLVTDMAHTAISVFVGNLVWEYSLVARNWEYQQELLEREAEFWECVQSGRKPNIGTPILPPEKPGDETIDMSANNAWVYHAADWQKYKNAASFFDNAGKNIKDLVPKEAKIAYGGGIRVKRAKNGTLRITLDE